MRQNHDIKHLEVHYRRLYIDLNTLELDVSLSLLKNLCSLFIERNFNSPLFSNPYRLSTTYTMYSLLSSLWRFCRYPVWKKVVNFVCTTLKENKRELCIDLHSKASLAILLPSFARRTFILVVEAVSRYLRLSFVIRKYAIFSHTDVYWFFSA